MLLFVKLGKKDFEPAVYPEESGDAARFGELNSLPDVNIFYLQLDASFPIYATDIIGGICILIISLVSPPPVLDSSRIDLDLDLLL